jgi:PKD repeat protein
VPLTVKFTNTSNDRDGSAGSHFFWDFGDGATSTDGNPTHTYHQPGKPTVTLIVTDSAGESASKQDNVTVDRIRLAAAALPISRSVLVGVPATTFVSVINPGIITAESVKIELDALPGGAKPPATLQFQTTDPQTNQLVGTANAPIDIPAKGIQSFLVTVTPTEPFAPTDLRFDISGPNAQAGITTGINTLLLSASTAPVADVVAVALTFDANGIASAPGPPGFTAFSVATINLGAGGAITATVDTGSAVLPLELFLCRTDPTTARCLMDEMDQMDIAPSIATQMDAGSTATFAVFVTANAIVPYDPEAHRIFVRFSDASGATRGATSIAVRSP